MRSTGHTAWAFADSASRRRRRLTTVLCALALWLVGASPAAAMQPPTFTGQADANGGVTTTVTAIPGAVSAFGCDSGCVHYAWWWTYEAGDPSPFPNTVSDPTCGLGQDGAFLYDGGGGPIDASSISGGSHSYDTDGQHTIRLYVALLDSDYCLRSSSDMAVATLTITSGHGSSGGGGGMMPCTLAPVASSDGPRPRASDPCCRSGNHVQACCTPESQPPQTVYNHELDDLTWQTDQPAGFDLPLGLAVVPSIDVEARACPGVGMPTANLATPANFVAFGGSAFSLVDFRWHPGPTAGGAVSTHGLFAGYSLAGTVTGKAGVELPPALKPQLGDKTHNGPLDERAEFTVGRLAVAPLSVALSDGHAVVDVSVSGGAELRLQLYIPQAIFYAATKLLEGFGGTVASVGTEGIGAPLVIAAVEFQWAGEVTVLATRGLKLFSYLGKALDLTVKAKSLVTLAEDVIKAEGPDLVKRVRARVAQLLKSAGAFASPGLPGLVGGFGAPPGVPVGGAVAAAAGASGAFDSRPIVPLAATPLRAAHGLRLRGGRRLTRARATTFARTLLKYGLRKATVRPLLTGATSARPGGRLAIAGGELSGRGTVTVELSGPGLSAETVVATRKAAAGAVITIPAGTRAGRWTVGIVDYRTARTRGGSRIDAATVRVLRARKQRAT